MIDTASPEPMRGKQKFQNMAKATQADIYQAEAWIALSPEDRELSSMSQTQESEMLVAEIKYMQHNVYNITKKLNDHEKQIRDTQSSLVECKCRLNGFPYNWPKLDDRRVIIDTLLEAVDMEARDVTAFTEENYNGDLPTSVELTFRNKGRKQHFIGKMFRHYKKGYQVEGVEAQRCEGQHHDTLGFDNGPTDCEAYE